jgi:vacuolar protein sorting-associated protein 13A/C
MNLTGPEFESLEVLSSADEEASKARDLLTVGYTRVQRDSPEFLSVHEGVDQSVDLTISTVTLRVSPEAILALYDFIMSTFVSPASGSTNQKQIAPSETVDVDAQQTVSDQRIRVAMKLDGVKGKAPCYEVHGCTNYFP